MSTMMTQIENKELPYNHFLLNQVAFSQSVQAQKKQSRSCIFEIRQEHGEILIGLNGNIDLENASHLNKFLNKLIQERYFHIKLDFSQVDYITSAGIGVLIYGHKKLEKNNGQLKLLRINEDILRVLKLLGFHDFFHIAS